MMMTPLGVAFLYSFQEFKEEIFAEGLFKSARV
jgi:hypothetical protein